MISDFHRFVRYAEWSLSSWAGKRIVQNQVLTERSFELETLADSFPHLSVFSSVSKSTSTSAVIQSVVQSHSNVMFSIICYHYIHTFLYMIYKMNILAFFDPGRDLGLDKVFITTWLPSQQFLLSFEFLIVESKALAVEALVIENFVHLCTWLLSERRGKRMHDSVHVPYLPGASPCPKPGLFPLQNASQHRPGRPRHSPAP